MGAISRILSASVSLAKGAPGNSVSAKAIGRGLKNISHEVYQPSGSYGVPLLDDIAYFDAVGEQRIAVAFQDYKFAEDVAAGEKVEYSRSAPGVIAAIIHLKNTGEILIESKFPQKITITNGIGTYEIGVDGSHSFNDGDESGVKFSPLQAGFEQLKTEINSELTKIASAINSVAPGAYVATPTSASIDDSESEDLQIP